MNVWVQCDVYRRMAYRAASGKWKDAYNHQELNDVIGVVAGQVDEPGTAGREIRNEMPKIIAIHQICQSHLLVPGARRWPEHCRQNGNDAMITSSSIRVKPFRFRFGVALI